MKKMPISQKRAKKLAKNPDATVGLLAGHSDEVYTDGNDVVIEMEEVGAAPTQAPQAPKSPAVTTATSPTKSTGPAAVNKSSERPAVEMEEVEIDQFPIPASVKATMGDYAPRFVCMGEGDASGKQFVQFLYETEDQAKKASSFLNQTLKIARKDRTDNRLFACSTKPHIFPMFAQMNLFRVTVYPATYFKVFGKDANPKMSRKALENAIAVDKGLPPPHRGQTQSRAAPQQQQRPVTGSSHSSTPLTKVTHQEQEVEEEDLYALLSDVREKDSGSESDRSDGEHLDPQGPPDVRVAIAPSQGVQVVSQRKDKEEADAVKSVDASDRRAAETETLLEAPGSRTKKDHRKASKPAVVAEDAVDQQECVLM